MKSSVAVKCNHITSKLCQILKEHNGGLSGIVAYDYDDSRILVKFSGNVVYEYRKERIGESAFQQMIELADQGSGLNSFIMRNSFVRKGYS